MLAFEIPHVAVDSNSNECKRTPSGTQQPAKITK
jgi:hypothetical protein